MKALFRIEQSQKGDVEMITEGIIRKTCKELDIEIIENAES